MRYSVIVWQALAYLIMACQGHSGHGQDEEEDPHHEEENPTQISDHRFFLQEIFSKYGHNGQMTFEGFEHLLESLGIGNVMIADHDVTAHKEDDFRNIHDSHDHSKKDSHGHQESHVVHPKGRHSTISQETSSVGDRSITSPKSTAQTTITTPVRSRLRYNDVNNVQPLQKRAKTDKQHSTSTTLINDTSYSSQTTQSIVDNIYHYRLPDADIPELIVNISSLVDQHQELIQEPKEIVIEQCLSPKEILKTFGINQTSNLNPVSFLHLCPAIIYELDQGHCIFRDSSHKRHKSLDILYQWLYALLAVVTISLCGLLSVAVIPIMQKWFYHTLIQFLVGLAVGSLSGDGLLHLMPHAMLSGDGGHGGGSILIEDAERTAVWRGFAALGGILFFFVAERLLAVCTARRQAGKKVAENDVPTPKLTVYDEDRVGQKLCQYRKSSHFELSEKEVMQMLAHRPSLEIPELRGSHSHSHGHGHSHDVPQSVSAVAWMVIMGDGLHNFCDGLAIGAAFASGVEGGISTTVAVFCHELPHELGDFAMLLRTGMSARQALLYNVLSSGLCLAGAAVGLCLGGVHSATGWVFAITAGIFLYVALVDMLPELSAGNDSSSSLLHQLAIQILGISTGVSIMLLIANYEQDLQSIIS